MLTKFHLALKKYIVLTHKRVKGNRKKKSESEQYVNLKWGGRYFIFIYLFTNPAPEIKILFVFIFNIYYDGMNLRLGPCYLSIIFDL